VNIARANRGFYFPFFTKAETMQGTGTILLVALLLGTWQPSFLHAKEKEVSPDEFIISFWHGPSPENNTPERFKEIADAGFNLVMPHCAFLPADKAKANNLKILDLCAKFGLKAIILDARIHSSTADPKAKGFSEKLAAAISDYASHPALYGYDVADEPGTAGFPRVAAICQALLANDPKHLPYVNLLPIHAVGGPPFINDDAQFPRIAKDYDNYLEQYFKQVKPKLLSYDEYDLIEPGGPIPLEGHGMLGMYFPNLEKIREKSLKYQVRFNNIILVTPHLHAFGTYRNPTFEELRFLVYTTIAYGGRGIMYFTYESVTEFGTDAIVKRNGKTSRHYGEVSRLNHEIRALAPLLCTLRSDAVYHVGRMPKLGHPLPKDGLVRQVEGADAVVSYFSNAKGSRYVMIVNKDYAKGHSITIRFRQPVRLETISPRNGQPEETAGTSPERDCQDAFVLAFGPGEGKLFKVVDELK
jgi:hypothetical protein